MKRLVYLELGVGFLICCHGKFVEAARPGGGAMSLAARWYSRKGSYIDYRYFRPGTHSRWGAPN